MFGCFGDVSLVSPLTSHLCVCVCVCVFGSTFTVCVCVCISKGGCTCVLPVLVGSFLCVCVCVCVFALVRVGAHVCYNNWLVRLCVCCIGRGV